MKETTKDYDISVITKALKPLVRKPIVLVGMMGAGKSYTGKKLAKLLALDFFDSDQLIEEKAGCSVTEIFERFGEGKFRESEKKVMLELLERGPCVIASGGGAVMDENVLETIKYNSVSIWLNADLETILARIGHKTDRPLLQKGNTRSVLEDRMVTREPLYRQADISLDVGQDPIDDILGNLIKALSTKLNGDSLQAQDL